VQDVAEGLVFDSREKPKIAVSDPFQFRRFAGSFCDHGIDERIAPEPFELKTMLFEKGVIVPRGGTDTFLPIVKDVDVAGVTRC
jgi:hypothetical protein